MSAEPKGAVTLESEPRAAAPQPLRRVRDLLEIASFLAVVLGIVIGFSDHFAIQAERRRDVVERVYDELDARWREFLTLSLEHPRLNPHARPDGAPVVELTYDERTQQHELYVVLIDLFEDAHQQYHDPEQAPLMSDARRTEWKRWERYLDSYLRIAPFVATWRRMADGFGPLFQAYVNGRLAAATHPPR